MGEPSDGKRGVGCLQQMPENFRHWSVGMMVMPGGGAQGLENTMFAAIGHMLLVAPLAECGIVGGDHFAWEHLQGLMQIAD